MKNECVKQRKLTAKSYRAAMSGCQPSVRVSQPVTEIKEFHFETDSRLKNQSTVNTKHAHVVGGELDFAAILRKNDLPAVSCEACVILYWV